MPHQGINFERVAAAADALVEEGKQPTIRAIREKLGQTGSPNTILRHLKVWREAHPAPVAEAPELPKALSSAIAFEIERAQAKARAEFEERLQQAQEETDQLANVADALETERDELAAALATLTRERDMLSGKVEQLSASLEALQARAAAAEQQVAVLADRAARAELRFQQVQEERDAAFEQAAVLAGQLQALNPGIEKAGK
jgi:chromosome segregation ATPase